MADLVKYVALLKTNVKSVRVEVDQFNNDFCKRSSEAFCNFIQTGQAPTSFDKNQRQLISDFYNSLSATNSQQLLDNLNYYEQLIVCEHNSISNTFRNRSVCTKLGVLLGVIVGILLL